MNETGLIELPKRKKALPCRTEYNFETRHRRLWVPSSHVIRTKLTKIYGFRMTKIGLPDQEIHIFGKNYKGQKFHLYLDSERVNQKTWQSLNVFLRDPNLEPNPSFRNEEVFAYFPNHLLKNIWIEGIFLRGEKNYWYNYHQTNAKPLSINWDNKPICK